MPQRLPSGGEPDTWPLAPRPAPRRHRVKAVSLPARAGGVPARPPPMLGSRLGRGQRSAQAGAGWPRRPWRARTPPQQGPVEDRPRPCRRRRTPVAPGPCACGYAPAARRRRRAPDPDPPAADRGTPAPAGSRQTAPPAPAPPPAGRARPPRVPPCRRRAGRHRATARPRRPRTSEPLTSQETRVALLVARGLSNREVAAALFLSPRRSSTTWPVCSASAASAPGPSWLAPSPGPRSSVEGGEGAGRQEPLRIPGQRQAASASAVAANPALGPRPGWRSPPTSR